MLTPNAPSRIPCATIARMRANSSAVGARLAVPITCWRTVLCPTWYPTLIPMPIAAAESMVAASGYGPPPSGPPSARVTP